MRDKWNEEAKFLPNENAKLGISSLVKNVVPSFCSAFRQPKWSDIDGWFEVCFLRKWDFLQFVMSVSVLSDKNSKIEWYFQFSCLMRCCNWNCSINPTGPHAESYSCTYLITPTPIGSSNPPYFGLSNFFQCIKLGLQFLVHFRSLSIAKPYKGHF